MFGLVSEYRSNDVTFPSSASTAPIKDVPSEGQNLSARFISCGASCQISLSFIRSNWLAKDCSNKNNNKVIFSRYRYKTDVSINDFTQSLYQRLTCQRQGNRTASCSLLICGNIKTSQCRAHISKGHVGYVAPSKGNAVHDVKLSSDVRRTTADVDGDFHLLFHNPYGIDSCSIRGATVATQRNA